MTDLVHADIFFFVTTIAVVILGIGGAIALYYAVNILRDLREVMQKVHKVTNELERDFEEVRAEVKEEGTRIKSVFDFVLGFITRKVQKTKPKKKVREVSVEEKSS